MKLVETINSFFLRHKSNGAAKCWGKTMQAKAHISALPTQSIFEHVSASFGGDLRVVLILKEDGDVQCWGNNSRGQSEDQNYKLKLHVKSDAF